jgi:hypothetical protein
VPKTIQNALAAFAAALARTRFDTQGTLSAGRAAKPLLVLGTLAASLLLFEIVTAYTGLLVPSEFEDRHTMLHEFFEPDPELGFKTRAHLKNFRIRWRETGVEGRYTTDAFGFRNAGRDYRRGRLFFVGDSFTWGVWLARPQTFPDILEHELGEPVINLAQQGYYIEQYERLLDRHTPARRVPVGRPAVVALCIYASDLAPPISPADLRDFYSRFGWDKYRSYPEREKRLSFHVGEMLAGGLARLLESAGRSGPDAQDAPGPESPLDTRTASSGMRFYRKMGAIPEYFSNKWNENTETVFRRTLESLLSRAITPVVFLLPSKESAYKQEYLKLFPGRYLEIEEEGYRRLCEISQSLAVECEDLTETFRQQAGSAPAYFPLDPHWNQRGHQIAARAMKPLLRRLLATSGKLPAP